MMEKLERLGFNPWLQKQIDPDSLEAHELARVTS